MVYVPNLGNIKHFSKSVDNTREFFLAESMAQTKLRFWCRFNHNSNFQRKDTPCVSGLLTLG